MRRAFLCGVISSSPADPFTFFKFSPPILKVSIRAVVFLGTGGVLYAISRHGEKIF